MLCLGFKVLCLGFRVLCLGFMVLCLGFRVLCLGFRVQSLGTQKPCVLEKLPNFTCTQMLYDHKSEAKAKNIIWVLPPRCQSWIF